MSDDKPFTEGMSEFLHMVPTIEVIKADNGFMVSYDRECAMGGVVSQKLRYIPDLELVEAVVQKSMDAAVQEFMKRLGKVDD